MLFALLCTDKPNSLELRLKTRPDHVAYLKGLGESLKAAGPFISDDGQPVGTLAILEAADRKAAEALAANDPYSRAGLFASVEIRAWNWTLKNPEAK